MDKKVVPIILCGGAGLRLWPLSTPSRPKPFHQLVGEGTLYQQTLVRTRGAPFVKTPVVVALQQHEDLALAQARDIGADIDLVLESEARDTCTALLSGVLAARRLHGATNVAVLAADHSIPDTQAFQAAVALAAAQVAGGIVLFGIEPREAHAGYGYILPDKSKKGSLADIRTFAEKPAAAVAAELISQGALWNSGNFLGWSDVFLSEARKHAQQILRVAEQAAGTATEQQIGDGSRCLRLGAYVGDGPQLSFDRAVVEHSENIRVLRCAFAWNDLGSWEEVKRIVAPEQNLVLATGQSVQVLGLEDVIIISTPEGLLVTRSGYSTQLKDVLSVVPELGS